MDPDRSVGESPGPVPGFLLLTYLDTMKRALVFCILLFPILVSAQRPYMDLFTDVLVVGGGVGGTAAAIQAARMGHKTILVEPTDMLGGMLTAAGVSCTDGNASLHSGIWEEFQQALRKHYGRKWLNSGWVSENCFEPHVADSIFKAWVAAEPNITLILNTQFVEASVQEDRIRQVYFKRTLQDESLDIHPKIVVDATELGDVLARCVYPYDIGMDDPNESGEKEAREKNDIIQDLTWAAILKDYGPGADKTIPRPDNYDSTLYFCSNTDAPCNDKPWNGDKMKMLNYGKLPNNKYMLNWPAHGNDTYLNVVEKKQEEREVEYKKAKDRTLGFIYFMQTQLGMKNIGLADDELNHGMALIPYNREGRRLKGTVRLTINELKDPYINTLYRTAISVGDYPVDHHHAQYPGKVPELGFPPVPAFSIPMGTMVTKKCWNLIVCEKGISVTNIVNGSTRLQPVVMLTGQAAGVMAAVFIDKNLLSTEGLKVRAVQQELLQYKAYLFPYNDVLPSDQDWALIQRVSVTGILRGTGKPQGWSNKMYFYPDSTMTMRELEKGFSEFYRYFNVNHGNDERNVTQGMLAEMIMRVNELREPLRRPDAFPYETEGRVLTRREIARIIDYRLDPFHEKINIKGEKLPKQ